MSEPTGEVPQPQSRDIQIQQFNTYLREAKARQHPLPVGQPVTIPTTDGDIRFTKGNKDWETNRDKGDYDAILFSDEFDKPAIGQPPRQREDRSGIIAGGRAAAFARGRTVLDLGSGEALALLEYASEFPETTFIGVDAGYDRQGAVRPGEAGVQLTRDNWNRLETVPDESVDTVLSAVAVSRWELGDGESNDLLTAVSRVTRAGGVFRFDHVSEPAENETIKQLFVQHGWDVSFAPDTAVAVKKHPEEVRTDEMIAAIREPRDTDGTLLPPPPLAEQARRFRELALQAEDETTKGGDDIAIWARRQHVFEELAGQLREQDLRAREEAARVRYNEGQETNPPIAESPSQDKPPQK